MFIHRERRKQRDSEPPILAQLLPATGPKCLSDTETGMHIYPGVTRWGGAVSRRQCSQYQVTPSPLPLWVNGAYPTKNSGNQ